MREAHVSGETSEGILIMEVIDGRGWPPMLLSCQLRCSFVEEEEKEEKEKEDQIKINTRHMPISHQHRAIL